ncbi:MAG: SBBP repeat-containing protein [Bacteroidota bacterium]
MKNLTFLFVFFCVFGFLSNITFAQKPGWLWAKSAGGTGRDIANSVSADASGNFYMAGVFSGPAITFGFYTLTNSGYADGCLVKYAASGNVLWAKKTGGTDFDFLNCVVSDASGNSYVTGFFYSPTLVLGSDTLTNTSSGTCDMLIAKYDANGNVLWAKNPNGASFDWGVSVAVDASGNSYAAGGFISPSLTFGSTVLVSEGGEDMFFAKYDVNGNVLWAKSAGGTANDDAASVIADASGNSYVAGKFYSPTITFGPFTLINNNPGLSDAFLVKYDAGGNVLWAKDIGGQSDDASVGVAADTSGNLYLTGWFRSQTLNLGSVILTGTGYEDMFLAKYTAGGNIVWAKSSGGISEVMAGSVAVNGSGCPLVVGFFFNTSLVLGSDTLTNAGRSDTFIAKYDTGGNVLWANSVGGTGNDEGNSIALDASGNIYIAGWFNSPVLAFGNTRLTGTGNDTTFTMFLAKSGHGAGIDNLRNSLRITFSPNPATGKITIETSGVQARGQLSISNLKGQELITLQLTQPKTQIDISGLPCGLYFSRLTSDKTVVTGKFLKQ